MSLNCMATIGFHQSICQKKNDIFFQCVGFQRHSLLSTDGCRRIKILMKNCQCTCWKIARERTGSLKTSRNVSPTRFFRFGFFIYLINKEPNPSRMTTPFVKSKQDFGPKGFRWISSKRIEWVGVDGRTRFWESVERTTRPSDGNDGSRADAVALVAKTRGEDSQILLIKQFRPPLGKYCLEMPAGLIDEGESVEAAALRELKEETGYTAHIISTSPIVFNDPGITNANMMLCICDIDLELDVNQNVEQDCHDGEDIETFWAPHQDLLEFLLQKRDGSTEIDARLLMYAMGYHQSNLVSEHSENVPVVQEENHELHSHGNLLRHSAATLHFREVVAWAVTGVAVLCSLMRR